MPSRWRVVAREPVRVVVLAAVLVVGTAIAGLAQDAVRSVDAVVVGAVLLTCAGWVVRTRWPATAAVLVALVVAGYLVLDGPYGPVQLVVSLCCVTVGIRCRAGRAGLVGATVAVVLGAGLATRLDLTSLLSAAAVLVAWAAVFVVVPLLVGLLLRVRREATAREREELLARGSEAERLRVAREVHDIAGHGFAVVAMQAGVALTVFDEQPDQARRCLEAVRDSAESALRDLHGMLGVLRGVNPGVADLPELVDRVRAAGLAVELRCDGDAEEDGMDEEVSRTVHRVVQEALTNVLRHAGPTAASVLISHGSDTVTVRIRDGGCGLDTPEVATGGGHGLSGLRSRTESLGGSLTVSDRPGGGVEVDARLPRRVPP